jgi:hypothetical protein
MFLFMPSVECLARRRADEVAAAGVIVNIGFAEGAPPGAGVR